MLAKGCSPRTNYLTGHLKRSILGTVSFTMWFATMGHLPLGTSTTLNYTAPLFIALTVIVIALKNREKAPWLLALAIVTGFIGVCLVLQPSVNGEQFKWALLGLFAASMGPIIFFQIKQLGNLHEPAWRIVFYFSLVGTIWGLGGNLILEGGIGGHSPETWGCASRRRNHRSSRAGVPHPSLRIRQHDAHGLLSVCNDSDCRTYRHVLFRRVASGNSVDRHGADSRCGLRGIGHHQTDGKKTEKEGFFRALRLIARTLVRAYASGYFVLFKKFSAVTVLTSASSSGLSLSSPLR